MFKLFRRQRGVCLNFHALFGQQHDFNYVVLKNLHAVTFFLFFWCTVLRGFIHTDFFFVTNTTNRTQDYSNTLNIPSPAMLTMKSSIIKVPINGGLIKYVRVIHIIESDATNEKMKQTYMERYPHYIEREKRVSTVSPFI